MILFFGNNSLSNLIGFGIHQMATMSTCDVYMGAFSAYIHRAQESIKTSRDRGVSVRFYFHILKIVCIIASFYTRPPLSAYI